MHGFQKLLASKGKSSDCILHEHLEAPPVNCQLLASLGGSVAGLWPWQAPTLSGTHGVVWGPCSHTVPGASPAPFTKRRHSLRARIRLVQPETVAETVLPSTDSNWIPNVSADWERGLSCQFPPCGSQSWFLPESPMLLTAEGQSVQAPPPALRSRSWGFLRASPGC